MYAGAFIYPSGRKQVLMDQKMMEKLVLNKLLFITYRDCPLKNILILNFFTPI